MAELVLPGLAGLGGGFDICEARRQSETTRTESYFSEKTSQTVEHFAIIDNEEVQEHHRAGGKVPLRMRESFFLALRYK